MTSLRVDGTGAVESLCSPSRREDIAHVRQMRIISCVTIAVAYFLNHEILTLVRLEKATLC